jgi:hypothetical protein
MVNTDLLKQMIQETNELFYKKKYLQNMYLVVYQMKKAGINKDEAIDNLFNISDYNTKTTIRSNCTRKDKEHEKFFTMRGFEQAVQNNTLLQNQKFTVDLDKNQFLKFAELFPKTF